MGVGKDLWVPLETHGCHWGTMGAVEDLSVSPAGILWVPPMGASRAMPPCIWGHTAGFWG